MTSHADIVRGWVDESWTNPPASISEAGNKFLSEDFKSLDENGNVLADKAGYISMSHALVSAMSDFKEVIGDLQEEGDGVLMTFHFEGIHSSDFDLSALGLGVVHPSGKQIVWPDASAFFRTKDGKIVSIQEVTGGMAWFLAPFGIQLPSQPGGAPTPDAMQNP